MLTGDGYDVLGVSVGGPAPLGRLHLELESGVTAIYGRNGSGKSRALQAIAESLGSTPSWTEGSLTKGVVAREAIIRLHQESVQLTRQTGWLHRAKDALSYALRDSANRRNRISGGNESELIQVVPEQLGELSSAIVDAHLWTTDTELPKRIGAAGLLVTRANANALACGPAVSYQLLEDEDDDQLVWDSIDVVDNLVRMSRGGQPSDFVRQLKLDFRSLFADRSLDPLALENIDGTSGTEGLDTRLFRPSWSPYPIGAFGELAQAPVRLAGWGSDRTTLRTRTLAALRSQAAPRVVDAVMDDDVQLTDAAKAVVERLVERANFFLGLTLLDPPRIRLRFGVPDDWLTGEAPVWEALDIYSPVWIPLVQMSSAQYRWGVLAVDLALNEAIEPELPVVVLLDEPEAALHRTAETHLVEGLKHLALELNGAAVVVATHSPAFLRDPGVRPVHLHRAREGLAIASQLDFSLQDNTDQELGLGRLGLERADTLQLVRVIVVVEGAHDEAVLSEVARSELADFRALVVRMQGAKNSIAVLDAPLALGMTDAKVLIVLDNFGDHELHSIWSRLRGAATREDFSAARAEVDRIRRIGTAEAEWLAELAHRALSMRRIDRLEVFGLGQPDIIFYLDPSSFSLDGTWKDLHREWRSKPRDDKRDFKLWLRQEKSALISTQKVRRAAAALSRRPDEIEGLVERIRELSFRTF